MISVQQMAAHSLKDVVAELVRAGVAEGEIENAAARGVFRGLRVWGASRETAHILREAMHAGGGEAVSSGGGEGADLLLFGTLDSYRRMLASIPDRGPGELRDTASKIKRAIMNVEGTAPPKPSEWKNRGIRWGGRTLVMGIINVTPDSFYPGSRRPTAAAALEHAKKMLAEGADILDIGGESSRPGAEPVSINEELDRVLPAISAIKKEFPHSVISIDTAKAAVAAAAVRAGAEIINDISALSADPEMPGVAAGAGVPICIMHMLGTPRDMQSGPAYEKDVVGEIISMLSTRIEFAVEAGIHENNIIIDPGIGFGKTVAHNLEILRRLPEFKSLGRPILVGASRKSFIGKTLELPEDERLEGSLAAAVIAVSSGADIVRVHDVRESVRAIRLADAVLGKKLHTKD